MLIMCKSINIHLYKITEQCDVAHLLRKFKGKGTLTINGKKPCGLVYGKWYIGFIVVTDNQYYSKSEVYLFTTIIQYNKISKTSSITTTTENVSKIEIYERTGNYYHIDYDNRNIEFNYEANPNQISIINTIIEDYDKNGHSVSLLYGIPGTGKTLTSLLLTKKTNGSYCNTWNPCSPSDTLRTLYNSVNPTKDSPLVISLDEVDNILFNIHNGVLEHKLFPIQVKNKCSWNRLLDSINIGMYPYLILILTTNRSEQWINELDPSYIRNARVNIKIELTDIIS